MTELRQRRRRARRRRQMARLDIALGVVGALVLLLVSPGLAITALVALLVLAACALSVIVERRRRRVVRGHSRRRRVGRSGPDGSAAAGRSGARTPVSREPRRPPR